MTLDTVWEICKLVATIFPFEARERFSLTAADIAETKVFELAEIVCALFVCTLSFEPLRLFVSSALFAAGAVTAEAA